MPGSEQERGTAERLGTPSRHRLAARCRSHTMQVPSTYEQFESLILNWVAGCVMSRTEDARGVSMHRERDLVPNDASLSEVWEAIRERVGQQVTIRARYIWIGDRVEGITFSVDRPPARRRQPRVRVGDIDALFAVDPNAALDQARPSDPVLPNPTPSPEDAAGFLETLIDVATEPELPEDVFSEGLQRVLETYYQNLSAGDEVARFGGRVIGFADTLAKMAAGLPADAERQIRPPRPPRRWDREISHRVLGNPVSLEGYLEGYDDADRFLRERYEQVRPYDQETGRLEAMPSFAFLRYLSSTYGRSRRAIREGLLRRMPRLDRLPRDYWER